MPYSLKLRIPPAQLKRIRQTLSAPGNLAKYDRAVGQAVAQSIRPIVEKTPKVTGQLRKSWAAGFRRLGVLKYVLENARPYAIFVEEGTRPHIIRPKTKKVLKFMSGGDIIFTRFVRHPGTQAVEMLKRSLPQIGRNVTRSIIKVFRGITRGRI